MQTNYARGARFMLGGQLAKFVIQFGGFVGLARILTPADFGLIAMVTAVITFASLLADMGFTLAGIQSHYLSHAQKSTLFWLNVIAGFLGAVIVCGSAPILANFYNEPRVTLICFILAAGLIGTACSAQFRVDLNRAGRFAVLAIQDVVSAAIAVTIAFSIALLGGGYWALVAQVLVQPLIVLMMAVFQARWRPGRPAPLREVRGLIAFGGNSLMALLLNLMSTSVDSVALGRAQGAFELGLYSRSTQLVTLIIQQLLVPLGRVALPRLSRAMGKDFDLIVSRLQRAISYVVVGAISLTAGIAPSLVWVLLGRKWEAAGPITQVLCIGGSFVALAYVFHWVFLARAQTMRLLLSELPGRLFMIGGAIVAAPFGAIFVAVVITIGNLVTLIIGVFSLRRSGISPRLLFVSSARPILIFSVAGVSAYLVGELGPPNLERLLWTSATWISVTVMSLCVQSVRRDLRDVITLATGRDILAKKSPG